MLRSAIYLLVLIIPSLVFLSSCNKPTSSAATLAAPELTARQLTFSGIGTGGIFDPSITKDPTTGNYWMSYSAVDNSVMWPTQNKISVHTRIAYSTDLGETWVDAGALNQIKDIDITVLPAPLNAGTWMHEVSTLVFDPGAPDSEKWKIIWQTFLKINGEARFEHSWIAIKMASSPQGLILANASKLFTSFQYDTNNNLPAAPTLPPISGAASIQGDTAISSALNTCIFAEPSFYASASALYLAIQCEQINSVSTAADEDRLIFLLKCTSPCTVSNAGSWTVVAKLLSKSDSIARDAQFTGGYAAPAIAETSAGMFLIVTPTVNPDAVYRGCHVFKFSDFQSGQFELENGQPKLITSSGPSTDTFNGACSFIGGSVSGLLRSELGQISPPWDFKIILTRVVF